MCEIPGRRNHIPEYPVIEIPVYRYEKFRVARRFARRSRPRPASSTTPSSACGRRPSSGPRSSRRWTTAASCSAGRYFGINLWLITQNDWLMKLKRCMTVRWISRQIFRKFRPEFANVSGKNIDICSNIRFISLIRRSLWNSEGNRQTFRRKFEKSQ